VKKKSKVNRYDALALALLSRSRFLTIVFVAAAELRDQLDPLPVVVRPKRVTAEGEARRLPVVVSLKYVTACARAR